MDGTKEIVVVQGTDLSAFVGGMVIEKSSSGLGGYASINQIEIENGELVIHGTFVRAYNSEGFRNKPWRAGEQTGPPPKMWIETSRAGEAVEVRRMLDDFEVRPMRDGVRLAYSGKLSLEASPTEINLNRPGVEVSEFF